MIKRVLEKRGKNKESGRDKGRKREKGGGESWGRRNKKRGKHIF